MQMKTSPVKQIARASRKNLYLGMTGIQLGMLATFALIDAILVVVVCALLDISITTLLSCYFVVLFLPTIIGVLRIQQFEGPFKRGVPVWREDLSKEMELALRRTVWDERKDNGFIRVNGDARLVTAQPLLYHTTWPYVAYIDLGAHRPQIEYRTNLAGILILIPFLIVFSLFIIAMMLLNHVVERNAIRNFILDNA